jgi:hypothetical protein
LEAQLRIFERSSQSFAEVDVMSGLIEESLEVSKANSVRRLRIYLGYLARSLLSLQVFDRATGGDHSELPADRYS